MDSIDSARIVKLTAKADLFKPTAIVLLCVYNKHGIGVDFKDILEMTGRKPGWLSNTLKKLQAEGKAEKHYPCRDSRRRLVYLTPEGKKEAARVWRLVKNLAGVYEERTTVRLPKVTQP